MKDKIERGFKNLLKLFGIILLYIFIQVFLSYYYSDLLTSSNNFIVMACDVLIYALTILVISLFFVPTLVNDFNSFKKENIKVGLSNWVKGVILMLISNLILNYLIIGNMASNEASNRELLSSSPIMAIILMVVLAPILEEIVFRLNIKKRINNKWFFMIVSGLLFGLMHVISSTSLIELLYLIPYGCLGFFFAKAYYETDNIYTSIIVHMFHNFVAIILVLVSGLL